MRNLLKPNKQEPTANDIPTEEDIHRLKVQPALTQMRLNEIQSKLLDLRKIANSSRTTDMQRETIKLQIEQLAQEESKLTAQLAGQALELDRAEARIKLNQREQLLAELAPLLTKRHAIVQRIDKANRELASALEELNDCDEKIYDTEAGKSHDVRWRMGSAFHIVERRARFYNSLPLCWPKWIRHKFQSSYARANTDAKTLLDYENNVENQLRETLEQEIKSLKGEINAAK